ncbi:unnamed protein product, partial [Didymodactylos carnosus]
DQTTTQLASTLRVRDSGYESCDADKSKIPNSQSNVSLSPDGQTLIVSYYTTPPILDNNTLSQRTTLRTFSSQPYQQHQNDSIINRVRLAEQEIIEV